MDFARSTYTPANALKILQSQIQIASRAIGSIFIPALMKILPYAIAVVEVIGSLASMIASMFNFEMPKIDYSNVGKGMIDISDGLDDVADGAKEAKKQVNQLIGGFDELNVYSKDKGSLTDGIGGNILGDIELPEYDMLKGINEQLRKDIDKIKEDIMKTLKPLQPMFEGFAKVFEGFWNTIKKFNETRLYKWLINIGDWMAAHPDTMYKLGQGLGYLAIAIGAWKGLKFIADITGISTLVTWLGRLVGKTDLVTTAFNNKNKALKTQTDLTGKDILKAIGLASAFGVVWKALKELKKWLDKNPLKMPEWKLPSLEPFPQPVFQPAYAPAIEMERYYKPSIKEYLNPIPAPIIASVMAPSIILYEYLKSREKYQKTVTAPKFEEVIAPAIDMETNFNFSKLLYLAPILAPLFMPLLAPTIGLNEFFKSKKEYTALISAPIILAAIAPQILLDSFLESKRQYQEPIASPIIEPVVMPAIDVATYFNPSVENVKLNYGMLLDYMNLITPPSLLTIGLAFAALFSGISLNTADWGNSTAGNYRTIMNYFPSTTALALTAAGVAMTSFFTGSSKSTVDWGKGLIKSFAQIAEGIYTSIVSGLAAAYDKFVEFKKSIGESVSGFFSANKWVAPVAIAGLATAAIAGIVISGGSLAPALGALAPMVATIPAFAKGTVATEPTYGLIGEYANAKSNPEIVAPQSVMAETVTEATAEGFAALIMEMREVKRAIQEKNMSINIDKDSITDVVIDGVKDRTIRDGESPI